MKEIGVVMACYQGEPYLPEQLASLRAQDDPCFHVLMADDGSDDRTVDLLQAVCREDAKFHLDSDGGHRGAIGNFWRLMALDQSDYTALCDQDDVWAENRLSRCRAAMADAEARWGEDVPILVHSDCVVTDEHGHVLHDSFFTHQGWDPSATGLNRLLVQNNVTGCTCLMNAALRRLAVSHGDPAKMVMHDWFLALTAAAFGHVVFVNEPLVRYRQHGRNVQGASRKGLVSRAMRALTRLRQGKARVALTYRHTKDFLAAYETLLPEASRDVVADYLATESMPYAKRICAVYRGGFLMQSTITRAGQVLFG